MITYQALVNKLNEFNDRTDHNLGEAYILDSANVKFFYDGSGHVIIELARIDSVAARIAATAKKKIDFSNEMELMSILSNPITKVVDD